jgi:hypothetical protein
MGNSTIQELGHPKQPVSLGILTGFNQMIFDFTAGVGTQ